MKNEKEGFPLTSIREIRILMECKHENIVNVKEIVVGKDVDSIFIVMEYLEHDLKGLLVIHLFIFLILLGGHEKTI